MSGKKIFIKLGKIFASAFFLLNFAGATLLSSSPSIFRAASSEKLNRSKLVTEKKQAEKEKKIAEMRAAVVEKLKQEKLEMEKKAVAEQKKLLQKKLAETKKLVATAGKIDAPQSIFSSEKNLKIEKKSDEKKVENLEKIENKKTNLAAKKIKKKEKIAEKKIEKKVKNPRKIAEKKIAARKKISKNLVRKKILKKRNLTKKKIAEKKIESTKLRSWRGISDEAKKYKNAILRKKIFFHLIFYLSILAVANFFWPEIGRKILRNFKKKLRKNTAPKFFSSRIR